MPSKFNMWDDKPNDSSLGVSFASDITLLDEHNARLGFDYVMVNGRESSVMVAVGLFDENGVRLSMTNPIEVPLKRSMLTTVKGSFLMQDTGGGVAMVCNLACTMTPSGTMLPVNAVTPVIGAPVILYVMTKRR